MIKVFFNASISITFRDKTSPFITLSLLFTLLTYVHPRCIHLPISQRTPKTIGIHICFQIKGKEHIYKKKKINRFTQMHQISKDTSFVKMNDTCLDDWKPQDNSVDFMSHILISRFPSNPILPPSLIHRELLMVGSILTIRVTPLPPKLSARSFVSLLSLYGIWPCLFFGSPSDDIQFPVEKKWETMRYL